MFSIQKIAFRASYEELATIGVLAAVGQRQQPRRVVFHVEILVGEGATSVNAAYPGAIAIDEIAALDHEVLDDSMKTGVFKANGHSVLSILAGAELTKVLRGFRANVLEQLEYHPTNFRCAHRDVDEHHRVRRTSQLRLYLTPSRHFRR